MSTAARGTRRQSHTMTARVNVLHADRVVQQLAPVDGQVNAEASRSVMRNLTGTLADPDGSLSGSEIGDLLSPYEAELAVYRGVVLYPGTPAEDVEWAPLGVFRLTGRGVPGDGSITITGQDRAIMYQGGMVGSLAIAGNTPVETAIQQLLTTRNPGLTMRSWKTGYTAGPLVYTPEMDVWAEAQHLAQSVGCWLFHDRVGQLTMAPALPTSPRPVFRWAEGDGLLIDVDRKEDYDTIHNVVVVQSSKADAGGVIQAVARDDDPKSPTFTGGRYGERPADPIVNPHISSVAQAQQVATTELARELGRQETASVTVVADPTADPLDAAIVHQPRSGLAERGMIINAVTTPLTAEESMQVQMRRSVLAQDGRILGAPDVVTIS